MTTWSIQCLIKGAEMINRVGEDDYALTAFCARDLLMESVVLCNNASAEPDTTYRHIRSRLGSNRTRSRLQNARLRLTQNNAGSRE